MSVKKALAVGALVSFAVAFVGAAPSFVQYQEWFNNYSAIGEQTMAIKRAGNSNGTALFNQYLIATLANGTVELRRINVEAWQELEAIETDSQPCRESVYQLFEFYTMFAQLDLQDCARDASRSLTPFTTDNFFRYANFVSRELSRITHHAVEALATYNKILEADNVDQRLENDYYDFNWMFNTYQGVLNGELGRFSDEHPIVQELEDCVEETVYLHQSDMFYLISYMEYYCGVVESKKQ